MNNIFENAYFGKAYKTRDGRKAIYLRHVVCKGDLHILSNGVTEFIVNDKGECNSDELSIVSEWQPKISEEELEELANNYEESTGRENYCWIDIVDSYKAGCKEILKRL